MKKRARRNGQSGVIMIRVSAEEQERYREAAAQKGYHQISPWVRFILNEAIKIEPAAAA